MKNARMLIALAIAPAVQGQTLLNDPLQGATSGTRSGGSFVAGGWQVTNQYDSIYWHVPVVAHGAFQFDVKGLGTACVGGLASKNEISHMYDYTYNNADNQYSPGYREDPYKQYIRKQCQSGKQNTLELLWDINPNFFEDDSPALSWDANTTYTFRDEWQNAGGNSTLKTYRNGVLIWTQTVAGSWAPAGMSVRIAASPRRADEGANIGALYSNVKVFDLTSAVPTAPTIIAPAAGETLNTTIAFVQWTGDSHTLYQARINTANDPDTGILWDSQQVSSSRSFTWSGTLVNNASCYAFVRLGTASGWGPWSAGRNFTINTSFVPPGPNIVRFKGNSLCDNNGPFLALGATYMRGLRNCKYDRTRFQNDCAFLASKGYRYIRILSMVDWDQLEIAPVSLTNAAGHAVAAWPDYLQQLKDCLDIAFSYGLRTEITIFAGAQYVMPADATRMAHLDTILTAIAGRENKVMHLEVANEYWQNGFPDPGGVADVRSKGQYLADRTSVLVALSSPSDTSDAGINGMYAGSAADLATVHFSRDLSTAEDGWVPVRDCYRTGLNGVPPVSSNEPIGPGSSVNTENDPMHLCMAGVFAWTANLPAYVFHSCAGTFGWTGCCPPSGTEAFFSGMSGVDSYVNALALLPAELPSWERSDGKDALSPFTSYSNGQANKWWPEVSGATSGCDRHIAAIKGGEFVSCPIGILSGGLELEARRPMSFQVYSPLTGQVIYNLTKNTGDHFTLAQGPQAYIIKGVFTDVINPSSDVSIDMGNPDVLSGLTNTQNADGDTTPASIGGRSCRRNVNPAEDYYFYFNVNDAWSYQGGKPDVYISMDYYDSGTGALALQYDSIGPDFSFYYKNGGGFSFTNTNTWKHFTWHVTDAYFGNRQNSGTDFRFGSVGNTFYLDLIRVSTQQPLLPVIAAVTPNPDVVYNGTPYTKQLTLTQGAPAPTWSILQGPSGLTVSPSGLISGWTPGAGVFGNITVQVQATNTEGSGSVSWTVRVRSHCDFDGDGDVDLNDFSFMQRCFAGAGNSYPAGCGASDLNSDGSVDASDLSLLLPCLQGADAVPGC